MARAVVVNAAQLASYSQSKQFLLDSGRWVKADNTFSEVSPLEVGLCAQAASTWP